MLTKDQDEKKEINYMGLSELMRMSIIFVTFCLNLKKKSNKDSEEKNIQINFHCKVKELLQWKKKKKKELWHTGSVVVVRGL